MDKNKYSGEPGDIGLISGTYRFRFKAHDDVRLRHFSGSAWRGVFGNALKKTVCVTRQKECHGCMLLKSCAYPYIFETFPPDHSDRMRLYQSVPHPYIFKLSDGGREVEKGRTFEVDFVLFGKATNYLPYIIQSFIRAGRLGLTGQRSKFECTEVFSLQESGEWLSIWNSIINVLDQQSTPALRAPVRKTVNYRVTLKTPLRLISNGHPLPAQDFEFHDLFRSVMRRIPMLMYFHQETDLQLPFKHLVDLSKKISVTKKNLKWKDWKRYSARQKTEMNMGGLVGDFVVDLEQADELWELLWLGQYTHAGKATTMGNGEYTLKELASLPTEQSEGV